MVRVYFGVGIRAIGGRADRIDNIDGEVRNRGPNKKPVTVVVNRNENIIDTGEAT